MTPLGAPVTNWFIFSLLEGQLRLLLETSLSVGQVSQVSSQPRAKNARSFRSTYCNEQS